MFRKCSSHHVSFRRHANEMLNVSVLTTSNQILYMCSLGLVPDSCQLLLQFQACSSIYPCVFPWRLLSSVCPWACLSLIHWFCSLLYPSSFSFWNLSFVLVGRMEVFASIYLFLKPFISLPVTKNLNVPLLSIKRDNSNWSLVKMTWCWCNAVVRLIKMK